MTCITCNNLKTHKPYGLRMAKNGYGGCTKYPAYQYMSLVIERSCDKYQQALADKLEQRKQWMA